MPQRDGHALRDDGAKSRPSASDERTGMGGWFPVKGQFGRIDPGLSPWYSLEINELEWAWVFETWHRPLLMSPSPEALVFFSCVESYQRRKAERYRYESLRWSVMDRQQRQRCSPGQVDDHQISSDGGHHGTCCFHEEDGHEEPDELANGIFKAVNPDRSMRWEVLPHVLQIGREAQSSFQWVKEPWHVPDRQ